MNESVHHCWAGEDLRPVLYIISMESQKMFLLLYIKTHLQYFFIKIVYTVQYLHSQFLVKHQTLKCFHMFKNSSTLYYSYMYDSLIFPSVWKQSNNSTLLYMHRCLCSPCTKMAALQPDPEQEPCLAGHNKHGPFLQRTTTGTRRR